MFTEDPNFLIGARTQQINGQWAVLSRTQLVLEWDWFEGTKTEEAKYHNEVLIEISNISEKKLEGLDKWSRLWSFQRDFQASPSPK